MKEFSYILEKVFADNRVSRSEKEAIEKVLSAKDFNNQQLSLLRSQLFDFAKQQINATNSKAIISCLEDINKLLIPQPKQKISVDAFFSPGEECRSAILSQISQARSTIDVCVFTVSDNIIVKKLIDAWEKGIKIRIVTDNDKQYDRGSDIFRMIEHGIPIRTDHTPDHMHHKYAIFDQQILLFGSYNWTRSAALNNNEDIAVVDSRILVDKFSEEFETLWKAFA